MATPPLSGDIKTQYKRLKWSQNMDFHRDLIISFIKVINMALHSPNTYLLGVFFA